MKFSVLMLILFIKLCMSTKGQTGYSLDSKIPLQGNGGWDYMKVDEPTNRLFITHADRAHIVDLKIKKEIGEIHNLSGAHHVLLLPQLNKGFISNGSKNSILVFDYKTLDSITTIKVNGENPDPMCYDLFSKKLFVFCDNNLAIMIDPLSNSIAGEIKLKGAPEFGLPDGKGLIYNNLEDKDAVEIIDVTKKQVIKTYDLKKDAGPTGMAGDFKNNRLFIACRGINELAILDNTTGKTITNLPIGKKVDGVYFDDNSQLIICSGGDGTLTFIKQQDKNNYKVIQTLATKLGAKTMAFNATNNNIYLCASSFSKNGTDIIPGTFEILEYKK